MKEKKAKRFKAVMTKKQKAEAREQNLKTLKDHALNPSLSQVLLSSKDFGKKSLKSQLKLDLHREKLGISFSSNLHTEIKQHPEGFAPTPSIKIPIYRPAAEFSFSSSESEPPQYQNPVILTPNPTPHSPILYIPTETPSLDPTVLMGYSEGVQKIAPDPLQPEEVLPILHMEQEIIETIQENPVTIICGETGCGKSTQLPRFLLENKFAETGKIGITQPRRIAAVTLAHRVAQENNLKLGEEIGYQVRYDASTVSSSNRIKFMTDGILLKEISSDFLLREYSVIIIDEAHERGINTDILLGLLSRIVQMRKENPLKLIIMSATIRVEDFTKNSLLFEEPPVVNIEARQYPVSVHFAKRTKSEDFMDLCFNKVVKIHKNLPPGGILVFVPGKKDVIQLKSQLKRALNPSETLILGLYSMLSVAKQVKVFTPVPNKRLIVISTNVAETSVTIPGIVYVIDSGLEKRKVFSSHLQMSKFIICHISQASASQRAGRAGRTAPGHCYRLYSSAAFHNVFEAYRPPDITSFPLPGIILQLKALGIKNVKKFPFPTPPPDEALSKALEELFELGAVEKFRKGEGDVYKINELGRKLAGLPLAPRYSKMLVYGKEFGVERFVCVVVAGMEVDQLFDSQFKESAKKEMASGKKSRSAWFKGKSDFLTVLRMVMDAGKAEDLSEFCREFGIIEKSLKEIFALSLQVYNILSDGNLKEFRELCVKTPKADEEILIQKAIVAGFVDQVCMKAYVVSNKATKHVPYFSQKHVDVSLYSEEYKQSDVNKEFVYIHPSSFFFSRSPPDIIAYQHLIFTQRPALINITEVRVEWLYELGSYFIKEIKAETDDYAIYDHKDDLIKTKVRASYGKKKWALPCVLAEYPENDLKYFYFAKFLMDGTVFSGLGIERFWQGKVSKFSGKVMIRVQKVLKRFGVDRVGKLVEEVRKDGLFLIEELVKGAKAEFVDEVRGLWKVVGYI